MNSVPEIPTDHNLETLVEELYGPRHTWRAAVAEIAEKAKASLPQCNGRVEKAVKLVLAGDVDLHTDGSASVGSMSDASTTHTVAQSTCTCQDFPRAPHGFCAHRLALGIARRARELTLAQTPARPAAITAPVVPLPEAPASVFVRVTIGGRDVQWRLRDTDEARLAKRLDALLARYPVEGTRTASASAPTPQTPVCRWHGDMKPSTKGKGFYCPAKMADGTYCPERA